MTEKDVKVFSQTSDSLEVEPQTSRLCEGVWFFDVYFLHANETLRESQTFRVICHLWQKQSASKTQIDPLLHELICFLHMWENHLMSRGKMSQNVRSRNVILPVKP